MECEESASDSVSNNRDENSKSEQEKIIPDQSALNSVNRGNNYTTEQKRIIFDHVISDAVYSTDNFKSQPEKVIADPVILDADICSDNFKSEQEKIITDQDISESVSPDSSFKSEQRKSIIDQILSSEGVHFKSQQLGEPELEDTEKRKILEDVLSRSHSLFLSKFGKHLCHEHLEYFNEPIEEERYEVEYHLGQFRKNLKRKASEMCIKNRRFDALKRLVTEGSYFSEDEMRKRNPLLYEQLVGQYLSEDECRMREEIDTTNITLVNLLMEQIDRENLKEFKRTQEEDEDCVREEEDTSDEEEEVDEKTLETAVSKTITKVTSAEKKVLWGEIVNVQKDVPLGKSNWIRSTCDVSAKASSSNDISEEERRLLFEEFRTNMFENFLQGKDVDFDYSTIDTNPEHDDIDAINRDEEDKYFDSESPETNSVRNMEVDTDDDEFEKFMTQITSEEGTNQITSGIRHLNSDLSHNL